MSCSSDEKQPAPVDLDTLPEPGDWSVTGPGAPNTSFSDDALFQPCAYLNGGEGNAEHQNLVGMHDGWVMFPWAPEDGGGGISFFDLSDPCNPVKVGEAAAETMRESHTLPTGMVNGREYLAVGHHADDSTGGVGFFDITDPTNPEWVSSVDFPGYNYPDAYFRVALSTTWVGDRLFVAAGLLGVITVDVSDPLNPVIVNEVVDPGHIVGTFHVVGDVGIASSAGLSRVVVYDIADPDNWEVRTDFDVSTDFENYANFYFANLGGEYMLFARKNNGGGPVAWDFSDPDEPVLAGALEVLDGDGGYVFRHNDLLFQGESNFGVMYDFADPTNMSELARFELPGDLDTITPMGNVAVVSVDEKGDPGQATGIFPFDTVPDTVAPAVRWHRPADGQQWVKPTTAIGISLDEQVEPRSAHAGSIRVWTDDGAAVPGRFYTLEAAINFVPDEPLPSNTTVWVEVPGGGVSDVSGNPVADTIRFAFSTGETVKPWPN